MSAPQDPSGYLTVQFLTWLAEAPRTYGETMDAWRTSCPRLTIWEDAVRDGLVQLYNGTGNMRDTAVTVTKRGRAVMEFGS